jgi:hypothetical protein
MTSRRRWENPRQKTKYESQSIKAANFKIQTLLKTKILRNNESQTIQNYFRHWKNFTEIDLKKKKLKNA